MSTDRSTAAALQAAIRQLETQLADVETTRASLMGQLVQKRHELAAARSAAAAEAREPELRAELGRLTERLQESVRAAPKGPTRDRAAAFLDGLTTSPTSTEGKIDGVKGILRDLGNAYRLDRATWDAQEGAKRDRTLERGG